MPTAEPAKLRRTLSLANLVFYGLIMVQPTAPMPIFGVVSQEARGHVASAVLAGMLAMLLTALSYGRMATLYPSAGSAYTYVSRELHPLLGFLTGWSILLDYLIGPVISIIWCSKAAGNIVPAIPFAGWVIVFALLFTGMNLLGIQTSARASEVLVALMGVAIVLFLIAAFRYVAHLPERHLLTPFFDPNTFSLRTFGAGAFVAVLTYIGFDEVSTLSEEARNPRRDILLATILTCGITGLLAMIEVYAGQLVWPDYKTFPDVDTAFVHVAGRAGGPLLFHLINATLLVANFGSGMGAQLAAVRLLYGMGHDDSIPRGFFARIHARRGIPVNNVLLTGALGLVGSFCVSFQWGAELLLFGAFVAFIGVNLAALGHAWRAPERRISGYLPPVAGAIVSLVIWAGLRPSILIAGAVWLIAGAIWAAFTSRNFRQSSQAKLH